jgi:Mlc titration factor MtfA (ptsG expression regulator)
MEYYLHLFVFVTVIWTAVVLFWLYEAYRKRKRLQWIASLRFSDQSRSYLEQLSHYRYLSKEEKEKIERSILLFVYTKTFTGVKLDVTEEMKIVIAFYACLLLLHIETDNCYDNLKTIIIYNQPVLIERLQDNGGIFSKEQLLIEGQSANDTVVIIWHEAKREAYHPRKENVIIHEFTHEIDFMNGEIDGIPPLERSKYHEWTNILYREFQQLHNIALKNREWGDYRFIGEYAAANEAEFFAVLTERFFESPHSLKKKFPDLYNVLKDFYHIDTVRWAQ